MSDDDVGACRIVWILFQFDHIWVFALRAPSSSEVPDVLLNQPIEAKLFPTEVQIMFSYLFSIGAR